MLLFRVEPSVLYAPNNKIETYAAMMFDEDDALPGELGVMWNNCPRAKWCSFSLELHVFVDASEDAFGVVSHCRSVNADNKI